MNTKVSVQSSADGEQDTPRQFHRTMGLISNFSLGFTYLSPLSGVYALFAFALALAGPPAMWWILIVGAGQMLVALIFGEVASQYPITGGLYPWCRRLWGRRYAWLAAWVYLWANVVMITSVAQYSTTFIGTLFGFKINAETGLLTAGAVLLVAMAFNMSGTKTLARVARLGFWCEIIGVIALGIYLLVFHRVNDFSVLFDTFGMLASDGSYYSAFLAASLLGLYMFFGFEACGNVAEEVQNPSRGIPKAMILSIVFGAISAIISFAGYLLAAPSLKDIVNGQITDPIPVILNEALGDWGAKGFLVIAIIAFLSCVLSLQAAVSRLIFSFARDQMLPASKWLSTLSNNAVPNNAMLVSCAAPLLICFWIYLQPDNLNRITAFAVVGVYLSFMMVVFAALRKRLQGWKPGGEWTLGSWGILVNIAALVYQVAAVFLLVSPVQGDLPWYDRWVVITGLSVVLGVGFIYMFSARPYGRSNALENDAIEHANKLRASRSASL
ncbi:APC family permease [Pseudomonas putida]|uniref:APC family permease n=1 Tax=Pseudomonas putida TaxID=303 RepID=UPI00236369A0|nr:APC family permease [Pseudomonas putida]MDD1963803.1 APC family permease [Pseudomonas putida]